MCNLTQQLQINKLEDPGTLLKCYTRRYDCYMSFERYLDARQGIASHILNALFTL